MTVVDDGELFERVLDDWGSMKDEFDAIDDHHRVYFGKL